MDLNLYLITFKPRLAIYIIYIQFYEHNLKTLKITLQPYLISVYDTRVFDQMHFAIVNLIKSTKSSILETCPFVLYPVIKMTQP